MLAAYQKWTKISYFFFPSLVGVYLYNFFNPEEPHQTIPYPFMKIRTKDFPWKDGDTDLFARPQH